MALSRHDFVYTDEKKKPNLFRFAYKNKLLYSNMLDNSLVERPLPFYICAYVHVTTNKRSSYVWSTNYTALSTKTVPVNHRAIIYRYTPQEMQLYLDEYNPPA